VSIRVGEGGFPGHVSTPGGGTAHLKLLKEEGTVNAFLRAEEEGRANCSPSESKENLRTKNQKIKNLSAKEKGKKKKTFRKRGGASMDRFIRYCLLNSQERGDTATPRRRKKGGGGKYSLTKKGGL